jgi:hypothetical protein
MMNTNASSFPDIRAPVTHFQEQNPQQRVPRSDGSTVQPAQPNASTALEAAGGVQSAATSITPASSETHTEQSKSSMSWVNYQQGVNLAEAVEPGSSKRMTRNELMAYPGKLMSEAVTPEQTLLIAGARVGPALEWAVANDILVQNAQYSQKDIDTALSALDQQMEKKEKAINSLAAPHPMRKDYYTHSEMYTAHDIESKSEQYIKYPVAVYDEKKFDDDFKADLKDKKSAYSSVIAEVLSTLPLEDRNTINKGQVNVYGLTPAGPEAEPERGVFLLAVVNDGKKTCYEVNTLLGTASRRDDYKSVFSGTGVIGKKRLADGTEASEFTAWHRPNIQEPKYRPKVDLPNGQPVNNEPFHSSLYVLKPLGVLPKPDANEHEQTAPNTFNSKRFNGIGDIVADKLFYVNEEALLEQAKDDPERVTAQEAKDRKYVKKFDERRKFLKGFVPFWNGIEAFIAGRPLQGIAHLLIDVLSFVAPVGKVASGVVKGVSRIVKSVLPKFAKVSKEFASYSFNPGATGVKWEGGVQGIKWAKNTSSNASKAVEQFRANAAPISKANSPVREIEFEGAKYFVAEKPDAGDGVHYVLRETKPGDPTQLVSSGKIAKPDPAGQWQKFGSATEDLASTTIKQMGGPMNELSVLGGELHTFTDAYKGGTRLNVVAHGVERSAAEVSAGAPSKVLVNGKTYTAKELVAHLKAQHIDPAHARYDSVRLMICYAAEGGENSFAREFQRAVGKPVKAFEGKVTTSYGSTKMEVIRAYLEQDFRSVHTTLDQAGIDLLVTAKIETLYSGKAVFINKADGTLLQVQSAPQGATIGQHIFRIEYKPVHFN